MSNRPTAPMSYSRRAPQASPNLLQEALQAKRQVIRQLVEGELPLLEAAAQFQAITTQLGTPIEATLGLAPTIDQESICRTVIGWVHLCLSDRPEHAEAISCRLESELQQHLSQAGSLQLPCMRA
ncbi:hypothetical protein [Tuwongella immobilis]|uniref:Uncharacterized protein n=1 Tax=Tuwongella immobilis TaxID=692036 RepID=A0A6C2YS26_9BACT|nr:hypothetical protein [Tuwongella immobilis]VIP04161.1 unnamed protein product [Tuwongella immobilis]VTS05687.1 unnamed protein product [Tuwongella immobilis]